MPYQSKVMKSMTHFCLLLLCLSVFSTSCQKDFTVDGLDNGLPVVIADDITKVNASVNGVVLDENNVPIANATVTCGGQTSVTNNMGIFYFKGVNISKNNGSVTVTKNGYFKATRCFITAAGRSHHLKIQLLAKSVTGTLDAATGGTVTLTGGATIVFPANAFATSTGSVYAGTVKVLARWIDPVSSGMPLAIPGDLRGIKKDGSETMLSTYGMVGAELQDDAGNNLQLAGNIKAEVSFPIPPSIAGGAPAEIPLWHFDESRSRWMEEGTATKNGSIYKALVDKFSFWNVDISLGFVRIEAVLVDAATNEPLSNYYVSLTQTTNANNASYGFTNSDGYITGGVPSNVPLQLEVSSYSICGNVVFNTTIGPFTQSTNLDTIRVNMASTPTTLFSGQIVDCAGSALSDGYFSFYSASFGAYIIEPDNSGHFSLLLPNCPGSPLDYSYQVTNNQNQQQSPVFTGTATTSQVGLGSIYACTTQPTPDVYVLGSESNSAGNGIVKVWKNGVATDLTDGTFYSTGSGMFIADNNDVYVAGYRYDAAGFITSAVYWKNGTETYIAGGGSDAYATDVYVNGTDVYISYYAYNAFTGISTAKLLKNGTSTSLSDGTTDAYAQSLFVSGNDVYVGGSQKNVAGKSVAMIWKNGTAINLSDGTYDAQVNKVFIAGSDVYAVGQEDNAAGNGKAVMWKNGVATYLTDGNGNDAMANGIFVSGADIYVCGRRSTPGSGEKAQLWKNGVATVLSVNNGNGIAHSVFVKNNDVYVTEGAFLSGPTRLWKNNVPTVITTGATFNTIENVVVK